MSEPDDIVAAALAVLTPRDLAGIPVVITAGGTREPLDPVRFLGNRSSGKQGVALAIAARDRGADVTLITAHLEVPAPSGVAVIPVGTALELSEATLAAASSARVVIMAAAVADYRPESVAEGKIKKETQGDTLQLTLVKNPDILRELSSRRLPGQLIVGFAAETEPDREALLELGRTKLARKGSDFLVLNTVGWTQVFATESNAVMVLGKAGDIVGEASGSKAQVATSVLDILSQLLDTDRA